jgi:mycothiol synthase
MSEKSDALVVPVDVTMRRPTLFGVPAMPILAAPLVVRRAQVEEAGALAALLGRAFEAESWDAAGTERELFCDETVRATLVVAAEGRLMAAASLQVRPDVPECGWVRWVATDLDRRREGLARALVIGVLAMAGEAGCREARLHTQTDRLAAIPLYLQLGFEPVVRGDPEREVWERVIRLLSGEAGGVTPVRWTVNCFRERHGHVPRGEDELSAEMRFHRPTNHAATPRRRRPDTGNPPTSART